MDVQLDLQPVLDSIGIILHWILSIIWIVIDTIVFIELNNPAGEVAIFFAVVGGVFGVFKVIPRMISQYLLDEWD